MPLRSWLAVPRPESRGRLRRLPAGARRLKATRPALEALEGRALPSVTVNVDAAADRHAINPNVYGVTSADAATLADLNALLDRFDLGLYGLVRQPEGDGTARGPVASLDRFLAATNTRSR